MPLSQTAFRSSRLNGYNLSVVVDYVPKHQLGMVLIPYEKNLQIVKCIRASHLFKRETRMLIDTDLKDNGI